MVDATRLGMLHAAQAENYELPAHPEGANAKRRGDSNPPVRICDVDPSPELRSTPNDTPRIPPAGHWLPALTTPRSRPVVHRCLQERKMRERRFDLPRQAGLLCEGRGTAKSMVTIQMGDTRDDVRLGDNGRRPPSYPNCGGIDGKTPSCSKWRSC